MFTPLVSPRISDVPHMATPLAAPSPSPSPVANLVLLLLLFSIAAGPARRTARWSGLV